MCCFFIKCWDEAFLRALTPLSCQILSLLNCVMYQNIKTNAEKPILTAFLPKTMWTQALTFHDA